MASFAWAPKDLFFGVFCVNRGLRGSQYRGQARSQELLPREVIVRFCGWNRRSGTGSTRFRVAGAGGAVGLALDFDDDRAVHQTVYQGHCQGGIAEVAGPGVEVDVRDESR
jgi:hypothetical protein